MIALNSILLKRQPWVPAPLARPRISIPSRHRDLKDLCLPRRMTGLPPLRRVAAEATTIESQCLLLENRDPDFALGERRD
ncbi:MAG: hypothetical protein UY52_C0012G0021 [Parcubacteria group bacterium GW2011_GWC2_49_9]|nr:MAG: hypothetical protein UY52_C0012G0021 [Parcubacteria group bacterium GW2011_GWC2_49_9]